MFSTSLIYRRGSDYAKAIKYSKESIILFDELNITMYDCILKMNLGLYLVFVGNFEDAKENFNEAFEVIKKIKKTYPTMSGVYDWEYINAPPNKEDPSEWCRQMKQM